MSKIKFVFIFIFASQFSLASETESNVLTTFYSIPAEEQLQIKSLFSDLFKYEQFAYSLFGDKPMSFSDFLLNNYSAKQLLEFLSLKDYCQDTLENFVELSNAVKKKWEIWKKNRSKFRLKKYLLFEKNIGDQKRIFLINIESFNTIINKNINLFKRIISHNISADKLLAKFKDENNNVSEILHQNVGLLGILLGFGKHNSMLFHYREYLTNKLENKMKFSIYKLEEIQNRLKLLDKKLQSLHEHDPYIIASLNRVCFVADPEHSETITLKNKYDRLNRKINNIYSRDDWFEQTLIQLTSE